MIRTRQTIEVEVVDKKFYVVSWDDSSVLAEHDNLKDARKDARGRGHLPCSSDFATSYPPVAFVGTKIIIAGRETFGALYNPRFKKETR
jgi:hypothetical protein